MTQAYRDYVSLMGMPPAQLFLGYRRDEGAGMTPRQAMAAAMLETMNTDEVLAGFNAEVDEEGCGAVVAAIRMETFKNG